MAAGLGFKTFTTGEVLTAADTNGYLMQGILVFATEAARNSAITSPQEGQFAFTKDTNSTWFYDGAAWVASGASGDVTGVTAGNGISVTSPTGPVPTVAIDTAVTVDKTTAQTLTNKTLTSPALTTPTISTATTNGDILYGTGSGALQRLGIGSTAQVLTVASGVPSWATPAAGGGGLTFISKTDFTSATTVNINSVFTSTYDNYRIVGFYNTAGVTIGDFSARLRASGTDTTTNYQCQRLVGNNTSVTTASNTFGTDEWFIGGGNKAGISALSQDIFRPQLAATTSFNSTLAMCSTTDLSMELCGGTQTSTTQFDGITYIFSQANTGSFYIYGYQKA